MLDNLSEKVKELKGSITTSVKDYFELNKDKDAIKFIKETISRLEALVKTIDKFLKQKGIDVKKIYGDIKDKAIPFAEKAKTKSLAAFNLIKDKASKTAIGKKIIEKGTIISSKLKSIFSDDTEKEVGPPEQDKAKKEEKVEQKKGWLEKLTNRVNKRKEEVEAEKKAVQDKASKDKKAKADKGWLGSILSGIFKLGGMIVSGLKSTIGWLGGFLLSGLLGKLVPSIVTGTASLITGSLKLAGPAALKAAKLAAKSALPIAKKALGFAARGVGVILTGPIGAAIAIGTAIYAGYKLYKYFTRGNLSNDIYGELTRLRLMMYGYDDTKKEHYAKIFDLDMLMKDYIEFKDRKVVFRSLRDKEFKEKVLNIFEVTPEENDKFQMLETWFAKRYLPAYKAYVDALYSVNNAIYFDEIDKLKPIQIFDLLTKLYIPNSIYNITEVPLFKDPIVRVTKDQIDALRDNLIEKVKSDTKSLSTFDVDKVKRETEELKSKTSRPESQKTSSSLPTSAVKSKPAPVLVNNKFIHSDIDGEPKPKNVPTSRISTNVASKLNILQGQLYPGSSTLEGISTQLPKEKIYNLDPNVRELFTGMAKEYNALTGKTIPVAEAFRSYEDQQALYNKYPDKAARPGTSLHEYGLAIDIDSDTADELDRLGLMRKYGFTRPIGKEKWHLEPIGVSMNPTLAKSDESFRFDAVNASPLHGGGGYGTLPNSILKKRDIDYQTSIYNMNNANPVNIDKVKVEDSSPISTIASKDENVNTVNKNIQHVGTVKNNPLERKEAPITLTTVKSEVPQSYNMDVGKYANLSPEQAIKEAARLTGIDETTLLNFAKLESSLGANIRAKTSTAAGLFQINNTTWKELIAKYGSKYNIPPNADRTNNFYNAVLAAEYAKENLRKLGDYQKAGIERDTALYLLHHFGPTGGRRIIKQMIDNPDSPIETAVSVDAFNANRRELEGNTVRSYVQKVAYKLDKAEATKYPSQANTPTILKTSYENTSTIAPSVSISRPSAISSPQVGYASTVTMTTDRSFMDRSFMNRDNVANIRQNQPTVLNTEKMEDILSSQLNTLTQIATILTSIDGKIDMSKLKDIFPKDNNSTNNNKFIYTQDKSQSSNSIDLSRKPAKI